MLVDGSKSVKVSDDRITATGAYAVEQLTEEPAQKELSQAAVADLVPPEALTFQYEPARRVWVWLVLGDDYRGY